MASQTKQSGGGENITDSIAVSFRFPSPAAGRPAALGSGKWPDSQRASGSPERQYDARGRYAQTQQQQQQQQHPSVTMSAKGFPGVGGRWWEACGLVLVALAAARLTLEAASEIVICNYESFKLYDSMYRPRTANFCVFNDVYLGGDVRAADFLASSLDYQRVAFANSKFAQVPPSLYKNFDEIRELYVRRCSLESLRVTRLLEKVYAGGNRIGSVQLDGNASNSLRELYLDGNRVRSLANLTNLPALEVLVLENNQLLGNVDFAQFARMERLWKLDLERVGMTRVANGLQRPLAELRRLDLSNNALTYVHVRMFRTFPQLEHLWLHGNRLYYMEADQVHSLLPGLRSIVIDDNAWGCGHLAALGQALRDRAIVIRHGDCPPPARSVHRVCCTDVADVVDFRFLIEMGIRKEAGFERDVRELRTENDLLRQGLERLQRQLEQLAANHSRPATELPASSTSAEEYDDTEEHP